MKEILNVNELITWNPGLENEHTDRIPLDRSRWFFTLCD